jgi:DNA ligase-associated metallophosphoesterase
VAVNTITVADVTFAADPAGALYWPEQQLLCVADLHLEKGSSFARRGMLLPPYDTGATLHALDALITRYAPRRVVALGDSFHDGGGPVRMAGRDRDVLAALQRGRDWIWIAGNHDPDPAPVVGSTFAQALALGAIVFATSRPVTRAKSPAICIRPRGSPGAIMQSYAVVLLLMPSAS